MYIWGSTAFGKGSFVVSLILPVRVYIHSSRFWHVCRACGFTELSFGVYASLVWVYELVLVGLYIWGGYD